jgi:hypothetical protein
MLAGLLSAIRIVTVAWLLSGCGLNGVRGIVVSVEENRYVIRDGQGRVWNVHSDEGTRRDVVDPGDEVRIYVTDDGYVAFVQNLRQQDTGN